MEINGKVDQIEALLRQGVSKKQLVAAGFKESTVRKALKRLERQGEAPAGDPTTAADSNASNGRSATEEADSRFPVKLSAKEMIPPEVILSGIRLQDGEYKLGFVDGQKTLMAAQWMVLQQVSMLQGLAAAQAETMEAQLRILREAKSESSEVAQQAAQEAAAGVAAYFDREKPWLAASPNPMLGMMADLIKPVLQNIMSRFMPGVPGGQVTQSGAGFSPPPGFSYKEEGK
jgi:hypothetical protein